MQKTPLTRTRVYPLIGPYNSTSDQFAVNDKSSPVMSNLLVGPAGELYQRPGFFVVGYGPFPAITGATEQYVTDCWVWPEKGWLIVACKYKKSGDTSYRYTVAARSLSTGNFTAINAAAPTETSGTTDRFSFAASQHWVYVANGGDVLCWNGAIASFQKATSCPTATASHVAFIDGMIVCNSVGTNSWYYAEPDPAGVTLELVWAATGLSAEAKGDTILAIHAGWRELMIQGQQSTEVWINTGGDTVFERQDGAYVEHGLGAPYSVICKEGVWYWLDDALNFVRMNGRRAEVISGPIRKALFDALPIGTTMTTMLKTISCRVVNLIKKDLVVLRIPGIGGGSTSFVWDDEVGTWSIWGFPHDAQLFSFSRDVQNDYVWGVAYNGTTSGNDMYMRVMERASLGVTKLLATTDGVGLSITGPETPITSIYSTPHIDHGTGTVKRCRRLNVTGNGTMTVAWFDDGSSTSSGSETLVLSNESKPLFRLGMYRTRRWQITIGGTSPVLRAIEEDIEDLG